MKRIKNRSRVEATIAYIRANPAENMDLSRLAKMAGMSRFHFARQFRAAAGTTPMKCCVTARVDCAKVRLAALTSIAIVAIACGFASQSHLTRVFRQRTGETPGQFQRRAISLQESLAAPLQIPGHPPARPE